MNGAPIVRDIVLVGGGHSHALLIRRWAMEPLAGVRLTLVSRDVLTPYSGMLPGLLAGHYTFDEVHIDLRRLCAWAGVRFVRAEMTGLDPARREISFGYARSHPDDAVSGERSVGRAERPRPPLRWDLLSLDTGSTPDLSVSGAREHAVPIKPVSSLHGRWGEILERVGAEGVRHGGNGERLALGVVGSGAGGFELVMAMRHALPADRVDCHWFVRGELPLAGRPARLGRRALGVARAHRVEVHAQFDVARVTAKGVEAGDGRTVALEETLWCTTATGPEWPTRAGLATDARGFVATDSCLRSLSHPHVFATGDIGTQRDTPSEKAGVFAVRQAPVLFENLRRTLLGRPLLSYRPQRDFLGLMATGARSAIASRGPFVVEGKAVWRLKDRIDRRFMARFRDLPPMRYRVLPGAVPDALLGPLEGEGSENEPAFATGMRCRGCGAKVGGALLDGVLGSLRIESRPDVLAGVAEAGDAAVLDLGGRTLVQSVDQLDAIVDDPWDFGRIAVLHALSDVVTEPVRVQSAQVLVTLPPAHERITRRELGQLMESVVATLAEEGATLVGGHTAEGATLALGLVVNALGDTPGEKSGYATAVVGDALVLTQSLGVGTLFAGLDRTRARGSDVEAALTVMLRSNRSAAESLRAHGVRAMTDVTGFGLLGHLFRLLRRQALVAEIDVGAVPLLPGARELAEAGVHSSAWLAASRVLDAFDGVTAVSLAGRYLLCDPQTGGGLLAIVPAERAPAAVDELHATGYDGAAVVGRLVEGERHALVPPFGSPPSAAGAPSSPLSRAVPPSVRASMSPVPSVTSKSLS